MSAQQQLYIAVKANAYGHGMVQMAQAVIRNGAQGLLVATVDEGIVLRQAGIEVPILVLGLTDPRGIAEVIHYELTITVSSINFFQRAYEQLEQTAQLSVLEKGVSFHLALDTGMGRIGLRTTQEVQQFVEQIAHYSWAKWQGVFTHFATAGGGPEDYVDFQWDNWQQLVQHIPSYVTQRHYANSAMGLWYGRSPQSDIVRLGIGAYGLDPKDRIDAPYDGLQPILQLFSEIVHVKKVPAGSKISYGATYEAQQDEWIATVPIGYADGWHRRYRDIPLYVDGHACQVVGVINMDQLMIRLPKAYPVGTTVTLIGQGGNHVSQMAQQLDTIGYEILTSLSSRIPRIYIK